MTQLQVVPSGQAHTTGLHVDDVGRDVLVLSAQDGTGPALVDAIGDLLVFRYQRHKDKTLSELLGGATITFSDHDGVPTLRASFPK